MLASGQVNPGIVKSTWKDADIWTLNIFSKWSKNIRNSNQEYTENRPSPKSLSITLSLQDGAHEQLQRTPMQFRPEQYGAWEQYGTWNKDGKGLCTLKLCLCQWSGHRGQKAASAHLHQPRQAWMKFILVRIGKRLSRYWSIITQILTCQLWWIKFLILPVNLVSKNENGAVGELLVCQQRLQLTLWLVKPGPEMRISTFHEIISH